MIPTHEVFNQPEPLVGVNLFAGNQALRSALAFNAVVVCFFSFLVWFSLLRKYLASRLGVFSFLTPILGVVLGAWLLNEPIEPNFALGALLVLAGIVLVSGYSWLVRYLPGRKS